MTLGWPGPDDHPVIVEEVAGALLLRVATDPVAALAAMTRTLPAQYGRMAIVSAPSITTRPDFFGIVAEIIDERLGGDGVAIRLVALGSTFDASTVESAAQALADHLDHEIIAPLGPVTVSSNGAAAAAAQGGARGAWGAYSPGGPPRYEPAWSPVPVWAEPLLPETALVTVRGAAAAHPVPAGFWILPLDIHPGSAGTAVAVPPDESMMTVFLGGCAQPPLMFADVIGTLASLPLSDLSRVVLLPGALPPGGDVARLAAWWGSSVHVVAAVPMRSDEHSWGLAFVAATGGLSWRPPPVPGSAERADRFRPTRGEPSDSVPAQVRQPVHPPAQSGTRTPAGWSFLAGSTPVGVVPATAGFVVEVNTDATGFLIGGKSIDPDLLADLVDSCCRPGRAPVVVIGHGTPPAGRILDRVYGALSDALDRKVIAADSDVSLSPTGLLYTSGVFRAWRPMSAAVGSDPPVHQSRALGGTLPPMSAAPPRVSQRPDAPGGPRPGTPAAVKTHQPPALPEPGDTPVIAGAPRPEPAVAPRVVTSAGRWTGPRAVAEARCDADDRSLLRQVLDGRYDAHARTVARTLAEDPEFRGAQSSAATMTGLVAVRAYCAGERDTINRVLRGFGDPSGVVSPTMVASCAVHGLRRLPVVLGPVFATSRARVPLGERDAGVELLEPAFIDVELSPSEQRGPGTDYAIWSVSARRLGPIASSDQPTALFAPGSWFLVLGVDPGPERPRVMLLDLTTEQGDSAHRAGTRPATAEIVERLRHDARRATGDARERAQLLEFPIGLDDSGRPYASIVARSDPRGGS